jgi:hypothetical protein
MRLFGSVFLVLAALACGTTNEPETPEEPVGGSAQNGGGADSGGGGMSGTGGGAEAHAVTVMTWNLEHFPKTSAAVTAAQTVIGSATPDVVGIQELDAENEAGWLQLLAALPGYDGYQAFYGDGFVRVGVIFRTDRGSGHLARGPVVRLRARHRPSQGAARRRERGAQARRLREDRHLGQRGAGRKGR